jgi:AcrR family transcriptional regulator
LRSRRTLERIVRASLQILDADGLDALTVQAIVERAGSSVGSFYARFAGKDELLAYLGERIWREAAARWDAAVASREMEGLALEEALEGAVRLLAEAVTARATYLRALRRSPGVGDGAFAAFQAHVLGGIEVLLLARAGEMSHPDPQVGVRLGLQAILAVLEEGGDEGRADPIPAERRAQEAVSILRAYLTGGSRGGSSGGPVDFFDIWG